MKITFSLLLIIPLLLAGQDGNTKKTAPDNNVAVGDVKAGEKVYMTTCFVCHGTNGKGAIPGVPDFTKTTRLAQADSVLIAHITNGFQSPGSVMPMPPKGGNANLTDKNIIDTIRYLQDQFGKPKE